MLFTLGSSIRTCPKLWWRAKGWGDTNGCFLWTPTAAGEQSNFSLGGIRRQVYEHLQTVLGRRTCWHVLRNLYVLNYIVHDHWCDIILCAFRCAGAANHRMPPYTRKVVYVYYSFRNIASWRRTCTFGVSLFSPPLAVSCLAMILGEFQLLLVVYYIWTGLSRDVFCLDVAM